MTDVRDKFGNRIEITDEHGNPVQLTDEHGNPIHIKGIATTEPSKVDVQVVKEQVLPAGVYGAHDPLKKDPICHGVGPLGELMQKDKQRDQIHRSGSSSSSSSEDDEQGGRRKKKGLKDKIKDKLTGVSNKDPHEVHSTTTTTTGVGGAPAVAVEHHEQPHEKKSVMEKIKEKLPGHHTTH